MRDKDGPSCSLSLLGIVFRRESDGPDGRNKRLKKLPRHDNRLYQLHEVREGDDTLERQAVVGEGQVVPVCDSAVSIDRNPFSLSLLLTDLNRKGYEQCPVQFIPEEL